MPRTDAHDGQAGRDKSRPYTNLPELKDGDNLLLIPPDDAAALAAALTQLADDQTLQARLSDGALALAAQVGWERIATQVRAVMNG